MASVTIYGSTLANDTPKKYIAITSGGNSNDTIRWYINGAYEGEGNEIMITPKYNYVISAEFWTNSGRVDSNKIRIGKVETFSGLIEPPPPLPPPPPPLLPLPPIPEVPPEIIVPVPITMSIRGPCGINGLPQTYTAETTGGDNSNNISWYLNDKQVMMQPSKTYTVTANMGDTISAIFYPFNGSGRDATGSNRIKIRRYNDMSCPPPPPPPPQPSLVLPPDIIAPPNPPNQPPQPTPPPAPPVPAPEPIPPSILLPPLIPPIPTNPPKPDSLNSYLPYIIGGVLIFVILNYQ